MLALDADTNPMLGISLGIDPEETCGLLAVRQGLDDGTIEHQQSVEAFVEAFGVDAPDGVRLVVALREASVDPGCICCRITPQQLLDGVDGERRTVFCDMEAGVGAIVRGGKADVVLVVVEPSVKSIDVGVRVAAAAAEAELIVVANRVRGEADVQAIRAEFGDREISVVPEDPRSPSGTRRVAPRSTSTRTPPASARFRGSPSAWSRSPPRPELAPLAPQLAHPASAGPTRTSVCRSSPAALFAAASPPRRHRTSTSSGQETRLPTAHGVSGAKPPASSSACSASACSPGRPRLLPLR